MKIKTHLSIAFGFILLVVMFVSTITSVVTVHLRSQNERAQYSRSQLLTLKDIGISVERILNDVAQYQLWGEERFFESYLAHYDGLEKSLDRYERITRDEIAFVEDDDEGEKEELDVHGFLSKEIKWIMSETRGIIVEKDTSGATLDELRKILSMIRTKKIINRLDAQIEDEEGEIRRVDQNLISLTYRLQMISVASLFLFVLIIGGSGLFVVRAVYRPIETIVPAMEEIGRGNFNIDLHMTSGDEISTLGMGLQKMADELRQIQAQLLQSAKLASIGRLASGVAHELNQPLMVINMKTHILLQQLEKDEPDVDRLKGALALIGDNSIRMKKIIGGLSKFSRESNQQAEPVDINPVIESALAMFGDRLRKLNIEVKKQLMPVLPKIQGNAGELEQVFTNLITNSCDALEARGPDESRRIQVFTSMLENESWIEVTFGDSGGGIPSEHRQRIFDPFYTTKPIGKGTGLGLAIVYGIIEAHQGEITLVESTSPTTTFRIMLPISAGDTGAKNTDVSKKA